MHSLQCSTLGRAVCGEYLGVDNQNPHVHSSIMLGALYTLRVPNIPRPTEPYFFVGSYYKP